MPIKTINDGSNAPPRLRLDINFGTLLALPPDSAGPKGEPPELVAAVKAAGYEGFQSFNATEALKVGLRATGIARVLEPAQFASIAAAHKAAGFDATTLHVGTGLESDAECDALARAVLEASDAHDYPLYIETHRATITQDIRRTLDLVARFPDLRFNADLSHWYTGLEMSYGDIERKFDALEPVFDRVRYMHGRIGDNCSMQVALAGREDEPFFGHFREMWRRCFRGFKKSAAPGDVIVFAPELLPARLDLGAGQIIYFNYARRFRGPDGNLYEESDRWTDALRLCEIAREAFAAV